MCPPRPTLLRLLLLSILPFFQAASSAETSGDWIRLFNGENLDGWELRPESSKAEVRNGAIHLSASENTWLCHEGEFEDFILEAEVLLPTDHEEINSGVAFRCQGESGRPTGYQAEIDPSERGWTGGLYMINSGWIEPAKEDAASAEAFNERNAGAWREGEWNRLRVRCAGDHIQIWVNGIATVDFRHDALKKGFVSLQHHGRGGEHKFRNVLLKPLGKDAAEVPQTPAPPNIVLIVADDLGYGDLGCYGHPVAQTPHIDRLAEQGVQFMQHYANGPECSPTRTALFTGRYQQRVGGMECALGTGNVGRYDDAIMLAERNDLGLPASLTVIPQALKAEGYRAVGSGKWHLGYEPQFLTPNYGWDDFFYFLGGNVDYFTHRELSDLDVLYRNDRPVEREGYMTDLNVEDAVAAIEGKKEDERLFLYVPLAAPHFPYQGPNDKDKKVTAENWTEGTQEEYVTLLESMDDAVGSIVSALDREGLAKNTLVIFVSDNGGTSLGHHEPYRGTKGGLLEGGIHVPLIIRWPGHLEAGSKSDQVCATFDLTKSLLRVAGADFPRERPLDGFDIIKHLEERKPDIKRTLFFRSRRGGKTWRALRDGDMKYVQVEGVPSPGEWLYDLSGDLDESKDLSDSKAEEFQRLKQMHRDWEARVDAEAIALGRRIPPQQ